MLKVTSDLIRLDSHPMTDYAWPFWQSAALLTLVGILTGLDPAARAMANIWRFNSFTLNTGVNTIWRR